jgi:hypothetical protein
VSTDSLWEAEATGDRGEEQAKEVVASFSCTYHAWPPSAGGHSTEFTKLLHTSGSDIFKIFKI